MSDFPAIGTTKRRTPIRNPVMQLQL